MIPISTPITLYQLPDDAVPVRNSILRSIDTARECIRLFMYGFTDIGIADSLTAAALRGVDVALLLDHTQSCGHTEAQLISRMMRVGFHPHDLVISTSPVAHTFMHEKLLVTDDTVQWGSLNFSPTSFEQVNTWCSTVSGDLARAQMDAITDRIQWALLHEPAYQFGGTAA